MISLTHFQAREIALARYSMRCMIFAPVELQPFFTTRFALHRLISTRRQQDADVLIRLAELSKGNAALLPLLTSMSKGLCAALNTSDAK